MKATLFHPSFVARINGDMQVYNRLRNISAFCNIPSLELLTDKLTSDDVKRLAILVNEYESFFVSRLLHKRRPGSTMNQIQDEIVAFANEIDARPLPAA